MNSKRTRPPEAHFAHTMDNLQPLLLNNSNGGSDWAEHDVNAEQVYGRQRKSRLGSERLYELTDCILKETSQRAVSRNNAAYNMTKSIKSPRCTRSAPG